MSTVPSLLAKIQALEQALHSPGVRRSRKALEELLAAGFGEIGTSGRVHRREEVIDTLTQESAEERHEIASSNHVLVPITDDAVVLIYESHHTQSDGSPASPCEAPSGSATENGGRCFFTKEPGKAFKKTGR